MTKYNFSIEVEADDEKEAIARFQDENIQPGDMDIEEVEEPTVNTLQREVQSKLTYKWWKNGDSDIDSSHHTKLDELAEERIYLMTGEGYTSGDLRADVEDVIYIGHWEKDTTVC